MYVNMNFEIQLQCRGVARIFHKGGAQLDGEAAIIRGEAAHGQQSWP